MSKRATGPSKKKNTYLFGIQPGSIRELNNSAIEVVWATLVPTLKAVVEIEDVKSER
jgi:hypothetical protein